MTRPDSILKYVAILIAVAAVVVVVGGYFYGWEWTGLNAYTASDQYHPYKTLWDWLGLFIVPAAIALIAYFFNRSERISSARIAEEGRRERALQDYLDQMSSLLLEHKLHGSTPDAPVQDVARAKTITVLSDLRDDGRRKGSILQFLREAELITLYPSTEALPGNDQPQPVIPLHDADFTYTYAPGRILTKCNLNNVDLSHANLNKTQLNLSRLRSALLVSANLAGADLSEADLSKANLTGAILTGAILDRAIFTDAIISESQIESAASHNEIIRPGSDEYDMPDIPDIAQGSGQDPAYSTSNNAERRQALDDLYQDLATVLCGLGSDVKENERGSYTAFRRRKNFASVVKRYKDGALLLYLNLNPDKVPFEKGFGRDVRNIGHNGTGDLELRIRDLKDIDRAKELIKTSYEIS
ncbi:MAG TPA: pentapeptide repeat-containing protein [Chloroflexia bacterium]